jgi:imidazolonepropionase-like amidohydrolase
MSHPYFNRMLTRSLCAAAVLVSAQAIAQNEVTALTGARIIDGTTATALENGTLLIAAGRITAVGAAESIAVPDGAVIHDLRGKTIMPGIINAHGHAGDVIGLSTGHYSTENLLRQLQLYASYGVTTVVSLGDDREQGFALRDAQNTPLLNRSRLYVAGPVLAARTPEQAEQLVDDTATLNPDFIKIRVDDNLGRTAKMAPEIFTAISNRAAHHNIPLAVHTYYLQDTKDVVRGGADFVAHSVRDMHVDDEFVSLMLSSGACYSPTLTREVSTFIYESEPDFFADPFFLASVDSNMLDILREPQRQQQMRENPAAQQYKASLPIAMTNLKILADAGVSIAMGTDSGPPARFQGYFEHLEMWMMQDAGIPAAHIIRSATGDAARCTGLTETGTLRPGNWADLLILSENPLDDIRATRSIEQVWIAGNPINRPGF